MQLSCVLDVLILWCIYFSRVETVKYEFQLLLYSEALSNRAEVLLKVENVLTDGIELCR